MSQLRETFAGIKAVIFDFDGVILESAHIKTDAFVELFAAYPEHQPAVLQHHLENLGVSRYDKFEWIYRELLGRELTGVERDRLGRAFSDLVMEKICAAPFVSGALETLRAMHEIGMPAFVASGTPQEELETIVTVRQLADYFAEVWGTPKKKPAIIRDIMNRYAFQARDLLMIGDGASDFAAASATSTRFYARITEEQNAFWEERAVAGSRDLFALADMLQARFSEAPVVHEDSSRR